MGLVIVQVPSAYLNPVHETAFIKMLMQLEIGTLISGHPPIINSARF